MKNIQEKEGLEQKDNIPEGYQDEITFNQLLEYFKRGEMPPPKPQEDKGGAEKDTWV